MNFESYGPFELDRKFSHRWRSKFWKNVETTEPHLSNTIKCYVFCLQFGSKTLPWYVGQTINQNGFQGEVFQQHKVDHYRDIMAKNSRHRPMIMLFPLMTDTYWNFSKSRKTGLGAIEWLETTLISMALSVNPEIANTSKILFPNNVFVNGVIGTQFPGRKSNAGKFANALFKS